MPRLSSLVLKTLAGLGITLPAGGIFGDWSLATQQTKIQASDKQAGDFFSNSVSISSDGNTAIVGAYYEDTGGADIGAAYIFVRSGSTWAQQAKIQSSDKEAGDRFGWSVSISGDGTQ